VPKVSGRHPLIGFVKGTVVIAPETDLTDPADPYWGLDLATFRGSLGKSEPPRGISSALLALWWVGKGKWERAHDIAQNDAVKQDEWARAPAAGHVEPRRAIG